MIVKTNLELLKCVAKDYDFVGKKGDQVKGTSYKATLISPEGEIFVMKTDEAVYTDTLKAVKQSGEATINITVNEVDGKVFLYLKQFDWE